MRWLLCLICVGSLHGCATSYLEAQGECVFRQWLLAGVAIKRDIICDMPAPGDDEVQVIDRERESVLDVITDELGTD